jgi:hypothetical protein
MIWSLCQEAERICQTGKSSEAQEELVWTEAEPAQLLSILKSKLEAIGFEQALTSIPVSLYPIR